MWPSVTAPLYYPQVFFTASNLTKPIADDSYGMEGTTLGSSDGLNNPKTNLYNIYLVSIVRECCQGNIQILWAIRRDLRGNAKSTTTP